MEERLSKIKEEEERIQGEGGRLTGSMIGYQWITAMWAVKDVWEKFSTQRVEVVQRAFQVVGLSLPIDGSEDHKLSIVGGQN